MLAGWLAPERTAMWFLQLFVDVIGVDRMVHEGVVALAR